MKIEKSILITVLFSFILCITYGQEEPSFKQRELGIQFGFKNTKIKDDRYSNVTKSVNQMSLGFVIRKETDSVRQVHDFSFSFSKRKTQNVLSYRLMNPHFTFSYQRKLNDTWVGGYLNHETMLVFPSYFRNYFGNNPISYTIGTGIGIAIDKEFDLYNQGENKFKGNMSFKTTFLNYVIRPAYAHPYPDRFLKEDVFTPTRQGMWKSILTNGKLKTLNKHRSMNVVLGINYLHGDHLKCAVRYRFDMMHDVDLKSLLKADNGFVLEFSYVY